VSWEDALNDTLTAPSAKRRPTAPCLIPSSDVSNALSDPLLDLRDANGNPMTTNNNWGSASNAAAISSSGYAPPNSHEATILITLAPGNYTAILSGVNGTSGVGLVEVYAQ